jgi:putative sterol carrier protein
VARFLSPEWLDDVNAVVKRAPEVQTATAAIELTIQQIVRGAPGGDVAYRMRIDRGSVELISGQAPDADVVFTEDWDTAVAVARGQLSPQAAFLEGRIRVSGDMASVMETQDALVGIDTALADIRSATSYEP